MKSTGNCPTAFIIYYLAHVSNNFLRGYYVFRGHIWPYLQNPIATKVNLLEIIIL